MSEVVIAPAAMREFQRVLQYYAQQSRTTMERFDAAFNRLQARLARNPTSFGWYDERFREALMERFPYVVYYTLSEADAVVTIAAIVHAHREPDRWRERLD